LPEYPPISAYTELASLFSGALKEMDMGKTTKSNKETKKPAALTPKEKKSAKLAKKHSSDLIPLIHR
jgi:hypothetical protein